MDYDKLKEDFRDLALLNESKEPLLTCYLNNDSNERDYREGLDLRIQEIRRTLPENQRLSFEESLAKIEAYLVSEFSIKSKGVAIFVRSGEESFFKAISFDIAFETSFSVDSVPQLYQLVLMKDTYHRYVLLITEESHARIVEVSVGTITQELWTSKPELRESSGRGWTKEHYQNHKQDRENKFIKEKIKVLDKLFTDGKHSHLIIAGNRSNVARVKAKLPKRLLAHLIDNIQFGGDVLTEDIVRASLPKYADFEQLESIDKAAFLLEEVNRGGLAVTATAQSLKALQKGQVDLLILSENYHPPKAWKCLDCQYTAIGEKTCACEACGSKNLIDTNLKEEMIRLAELMSSDIEILRNSDALLEIRGVGCLLRY